MIKKYILTQDCFLGKEGDIILVEGIFNETETWINQNTNMRGSPVGPEWKFLEEIKDE